MKKYLLFLIFSIFWINLNAQIYQEVPIFKNGIINSKSLETLQDGVGLNSIHLSEGNKTFILQRVNLFGPEFSVQTSSGQSLFEPQGVFYQGSVEGEEGSVATLSITGQDLNLSYSTNEGNFEIVNVKKGRYLTRKIPLQSQFSTECYTTDSLEIKSEYREIVGERGGVCRSVQIYFECDYDLYLKKGSVVNVVSYVNALFNQVSALYAVEQIPIQISQIKVWDTPDPYIPFTSTSSVLNKFRSTLGTNFNGNLAHLLSTRSLGGGIAYVDVLCLKQYAFGVSAIQTSFQNVPVYSWSVEVVTHELGHNLGSWHTHSCNWPGGALDNCYTPEGSCNPGPAPIGGGTIMSYCHLTNYGINFSKGFGPVPGNHIRNKFANASCLTGSAGAPTNLVSSNITQTSAKVSWSAIPGNIYYTLQYKKNSSSFWITFDSLQSTSMNLGGLTPATLYDWQVKGECSGFTAIQQFMTAAPGGCAMITSATISSITQSTALITWGSVPGATSYVIQYKRLFDPQWTEISGIPGTSFQLTNLNSGTDYSVKIRPNCNSSFTIPLNFTTLYGGTCQPPTNLKNEIVNGGWVKISWQDPGFTNGWFIAIKTANMNQWFQLGPINVKSVIISGLQPNTTYNWRVKNGCSDWSYIMTFTTTNFTAPGSGSLIVFSEGVKVFPNPATNELQIFGAFSDFCRIFDSTGRLISTSDIFEQKVDIEKLIPGVYFLNVDNQWVRFVKI